MRTYEEIEEEIVKVIKELQVHYKDITEWWLELGGMTKNYGYVLTVYFEDNNWNKRIELKRFVMTKEERDMYMLHKFEENKSEIFKKYFRETYEY